MPDETPPSSGWESQQDQSSDADALGQLLRAALEVVPLELQARCIDALRELLKALRALLEWWIARLEHRGPDGKPAEVRDIPVL